MEYNKYVNKYDCLNFNELALSLCLFVWPTD